MRSIVFSLCACLAMAGTVHAQSAADLHRGPTVPPTGSPVGPGPKSDNTTAAKLTDSNASKPGGSHVEGTTMGTSRGGTDKVPDGSPAQLNAPKAH